MTRLCCCGEGGFAEDTVSEDTSAYEVPTVGTKPALLVTLTVEDDYELTGVVPTLKDQRLVLYNRPDSPGTLRLTNEDPSEPAVNRVRTPNEGPLDVPPGKYVELVRVTTDAGVRWTVPGGTATAYDSTTADPLGITTTQNDLAVPDPAPYVPLVPAADSVLTGVVYPPNGPPSMTFTNTSAYSLTLTHEDGSSATDNQFHLSTGTALVIPPGVSFTLYKTTGGGPQQVESPALFEGAFLAIPETTLPADNDPPAGVKLAGLDADGDLALQDSAGNVTKVGAGAAYTEGTLAAAGTTQGTAAAVTATATEITSATGGSADGVILPAGSPAERRVIRNATVTTIKVYPPSGAQINNLGTDNPQTIAGSLGGLFLRTSTTRWTYIATP